MTKFSRLKKSALSDPIYNVHVGVLYGDNKTSIQTLDFVVDFTYITNIDEFAQRIVDVVNSNFSSFTIGYNDYTILQTSNSSGVIHNDQVAISYSTIELDYVFNRQDGTQEFNNPF